MRYLSYKSCICFILTDDKLQLLTSCVLHVTYFLLMVVAGAFLRLPTASRFLLLLVIVSNAAAEISYNTSLDFAGMTAFLLSTSLGEREREREREMFYLTMHSTHFIYGYMSSDIWLRTILIARKETRCCHIGYSYRLTARVLLYAPSHRQDSTYHSLCCTSCGALAGMRNSSMCPPHEGSIRRPIAP